MDVQRGAVDAFGFEEPADESAVPVVTYAGHDAGAHAEPREARRHVASESTDETFEGAYLFEGRIQLERIEIRAHSAEDIRVDGHGAISRASSHARSHASAIASARRPSSPLTRGGLR